MLEVDVPHRRQHQHRTFRTVGHVQHVQAPPLGITPRRLTTPHRLGRDLAHEPHTRRLDPILQVQPRPIPPRLDIAQNHRRRRPDPVEQARIQRPIGQHSQFLVDRRRTQPPARTVSTTVRHPRHEPCQCRLRPRGAVAQRPPFGTVETFKRPIDGRREVAERHPVSRTEEVHLRHIDDRRSCFREPADRGCNKNILIA